MRACTDAKTAGAPGRLLSAKLAQQLADLEQRPFYGVFLDLKKRLMRWIENGACLCWRDTDKAQMVCRALGNYGVPFKASRGVTQGGPLSAKLVNILVDSVAWEWLVRLLQGATKDHEEGYLAKLIRFFLQLSMWMMPTLHCKTLCSSKQHWTSWLNSSSVSASKPTA